MLQKNAEFTIINNLTTSDNMHPYKHEQTLMYFGLIKNARIIGNRNIS